MKNDEVLEHLVMHAVARLRDPRLTPTADNRKLEKLTPLGSTIRCQPRSQLRDGLMQVVADVGDRQSGNFSDLSIAQAIVQTQTQYLLLLLGELADASSQLIQLLALFGATIRAVTGSILQTGYIRCCVNSTHTSLTSR